MVKTENKAEEKGADVKVFAVIETGGKQYKVSEGSVIKIERLPGDYKKGDRITFDSVILTDDGSKINMGEPYLEKTKVLGEFIEEGRNKKVEVMKYKSKSRYFRNKGHRQHFMKVKIVSIK